MNMENKLYSDKWLGLQLSVLILLQPLIDIYRSFVGNKIEIGGISLVELFNIILIGYLCLLFLLNRKQAKQMKSFWPAIAYMVILIIYLILHCYHVLQFDASVMSGTEISVVTEIYVIFRAYLLPLLLLYMLIFIRVEQKRFIKTLLCCSWFISVVIIITNLLKVSFVTYASYLPDGATISQNMIEWFTKTPPQDVKALTSKGWFYSGNQIGLILFMLLPVSVYTALTRHKVMDYVLVACQIIAMMMVATKTAAIGGLMILVVMAVLYLVFSLVQKKLRKNIKPLIVLLLIFACGVGLYQFSPTKKLISVHISNYEWSDQTQNELDELLEENDAEKGDPEKNSAVQKLESLYYTFGIHPEFVSILPIKNNADFWMKVISDPDKPYLEFRSFKQTLLNEILKKNDNPLDPWLGIGYSTNFPYLEKDVVSQNAWFGIAGSILFIVPYLAALVICAIQIFRRFKSRFTLFSCALALSSGGGFLISLTAGHLFGFLFPMFIFTYILAQLIHSAKCEQPDEVDQAAT